MSGQPVSVDDLDEGKALIDKISVIMKRMVDEEKRLFGLAVDEGFEQCAQNPRKHCFLSF